MITCLPSVKTLGLDMLSLRDATSQTTLSRMRKGIVPGALGSHSLVQAVLPCGPSRLMILVSRSRSFDCTASSCWLVDELILETSASIFRIRTLREGVTR